jgi:transposase
LDEGILMLYDITSTYFEGEYTHSELVEFGYNRDKKRGKEQINIGLLCSKEGCPVAVSVIRGGTKDAETVINKINLIKKDFGISDVVFVGDRGMITKARLEDMRPGNEHFVHKISALTHAGIKRLINDNDCVQLSMFDERQPIEITLSDDPGTRYALCLNPIRAAKESKTRRDMIAKLENKLEAISTPKRKTSDATVGVRVGKILAKSTVGKFFDYSISEGKLKYSVDETKVREEALYDGHYVIFTDVASEQMNIQEVVDGYRSLVHVEQAFRNLKSPTLEIRPVFHKTDDRIRCHVFLCMLAYYLLWNFKQRLKPIFDNDGTGEHRRYTIDFLIKLLSSIQKMNVSFCNVESVFVSDVSAEQQMVLDLLNEKVA